MTYFGVEEALKMGRKVFANYHLKDVPYEFITFADLLAWSKSCEDCRDSEVASNEACNNCGGRSFSDACILIDEAHVFVDSRAGMTKVNRLFSYLMLQTGKEGINLYYTTQDFGQVEKRLRQRTDIAIHVRRNGNLHLLTINDMTDAFRVRPKRAVVNGPDVYPFFNTKEVVRYVDPATALKGKTA